MAGRCAPAAGRVFVVLHATGSRQPLAPGCRRRRIDVGCRSLISKAAPVRLQNSHQCDLEIQRHCAQPYIQHSNDRWSKAMLTCRVTLQTRSQAGSSRPSCASPSDQTHCRAARTDNSFTAARCSPRRRCERHAGAATCAPPTHGRRR